MGAPLLLLLCMIVCSCQTSILTIPELTDSFKQELMEHDVILLGERHDNHRHHLYQAAVIEFLKTKNKLGRVYMEHLTADQQERLEKGKPQSVQEFAQLADWSQSGWPDFSIFSELAAKLLEQTPIGVGIPRKQLSGLYSDKNPELITEELEIKTGLKKPLEETVKDKLLSVLKESHCGHLPPKYAEKMLGIQRYRDAYMVSRFQEQNGLIDVYLLGAGHGNLIYGIPLYFSTAYPKKKLLSVIFLEDGDSSPNEEYHFFVGTLRTQREDPCAKLKKRFSQKKTRS